MTQKTRTWSLVILLISISPFLIKESLSYEYSILSTLDTLSLCALIYAFLTIAAFNFSRSFPFALLLITGIIIGCYSVIKEYFDFYGAYPTYEAYLMMNELFTAFKFFVNYKNIALALCFIFVTILLLKSINKIRPENNRKLSLLLTTPSLLIFGISIFQFNQQRLEYINDNTGEISLESIHEDPINSIIRSTPLFSPLFESQGNLNHERLISLLSKQYQDGELNNLPEEFGYQNYANIIPNYTKYKTLLHPENPLYTKPESEQEKSTSKNVIIIVLESFRKLETRTEQAQILTPNILNIEKESIVVENFFSTNVSTVKSEMSILCGVPEVSTGTPYAVTNGNFRGKCLPRILAENGYKTFWFHGNTEEFFNRKVFHKSLGFQNLYSKEDFIEDGYQDKNDIGWGVSDENLFNKAFQVLENVQTPFFAELLTVTNHNPFNWDYGIENYSNDVSEDKTDRYNNYLNGLHYSDYALGLFWDAFKASKLHENTIVVITGDHGVPLYPNYINEGDRNFSSKFKVPMLIYFKGIPPKVINKPASHLDVAPTILAELNIFSENQFMGRPILEEDYIARPIYMVAPGGYNFKFGEHECFSSYSSCKNSSKACFKSKNMFCNMPAEQANLAEEQRALFNYLRIAQSAGYPLPMSEQ